MTMLNHERLLHLLHYDADSGSFRWKVSLRGIVKAGASAGCLNSSGYLQIMIDRKRYLAHRLAWFYSCGNWPSFEIDHINRDKLDNRLANLRDVSKTVNMQNTRASPTRNKHGSPGVRAGEAGTYRARMQAAGRRIELGSFATIEHAAAAYETAKKDQQISSLGQV